MEINIPYGNIQLACRLPENSSTLTTREPEAIITPSSFKEKFRAYLDNTTVNLRRTIVVVADKTRVCGYPEYLPLLTDILMEYDMEEEGLQFIIAYGTHPRQSDQDCLQCYGPIYNRFPFIHHSCDEKELFTNCGTTSRGTPIRCRSDIMDASCVITMGPVCHHYFAGYGGGRKLLFPGCGEREAIYKNHSLYLDRENNRLATSCQPGILDNNPLALDLFEIERNRPADIGIHGIMDSQGHLCNIVIGAGEKNFRTACALHSKLCEVAPPSFPVVLASCGGFPKDINFIQSHKAIHNGAMFVKDGGTLLIYCELPDGIGSKTFLPWFEKKNFEEAFLQLCHQYEGNGGTALAMMTKNRRIRIILVSELEKRICQIIGVQKWSHSQVCQYLKTAPAPLGYIPNASLLVRKQQ